MNLLYNTMIKNNLHIILLSLVIILLNLWPSFFAIPGTYFLLDTGFTPFTQLRGFFETTFYWHITHILSYIFGYALFSKIFFLGVILTGVVTGVMISRYIGKLFPQYKGKTLDIIAIITAIYNPFIYERIISQTGIALGSYLMIIGIILLISSTASFSLNKGNKMQSPPPFSKEELRWIKTTLTTLALGTAWMVYPHAILLIILVLGIFSLIYFKNILRYILIFLGVIILNLNWLIGGFIAPESGRVSKIETFDRVNIEVFQGNGLSGLGVDITHLLGYGFWGERYHIVSPDEVISFWYVFAFIVLGIIIFGGYRLYHRDKKMFMVMTSIGIIAYILSMGIASDIWGWLSELLYTYIPFYIGMREPQKWFALTQGVYMIFFTLGAISIIFYLHSRYKLKYLIIIPLCFLPILWTPASIVGYWGQLNMSEYPDDIFVAQVFLENNISQDEKILNLPWHSYMSCNWTYGKITANRTKDIFYPHNIISSDNIEIGNLYTNSSSETSLNIENYLRTKDISLLEKNNISYILLLKTCADRSNYTYIGEEIDSYQKIFESEHIDIYKIHYER